MSGPTVAASRRATAKLVANWIDVFSGLVCAGELPGRWPQTLLIDSKNFRIDTGPHAGRGFHVLAAMGSQAAEPGKWAPVPKLWRLEPFARKDQAAWEAFFSSLEGSPRVIVSDADNALACAIQSVVGDAAPEHRLCEWHLGRKLREHVPDDILEAPDDPIARALPGAFHSPAAWKTLVEAIGHAHTDVAHGALTLAMRWLERYGTRVEAQIATRDPGGPHSTGPVEQVLREVDRRIGDRVGSFTNRARMTNLLALMTLDLDGARRRPPVGRPPARTPLPRRRTPRQPAPSRRPQRPLLTHRLTRGRSISIRIE